MVSYDPDKSPFVSGGPPLAGHCQTQIVTHSDYLPVFVEPHTLEFLEWKDQPIYAVTVQETHEFLHITWGGAFYFLQLDRCIPSYKR